MRFGMYGKLIPRYIEPFEFLKHIGLVAYRLPPPPHLSSIYNVFHISMLRKYELDLSYITTYEPIALREDLTFEDAPVRIPDSKE